MNRKTLKHAFVGTLLILVVIVALQNSESVETRLLFVTLTMPRVILICSSLAIGVVIGLVLGTRSTRKPAEHG